MLPLVKGLQWREVEQALTENPRLIEFRDKRGRNWLHLCCGVNIRERKLKASDSVKTADVLLNGVQGREQQVAPCLRAVCTPVDRDAPVDLHVTRAALPA